MSLGERIKAARDRTGMSQVDFADKIKVSKQTLYKYENGIITNIPSDKIEAIAKLGNVLPAYLMGWTDSEAAQGFYESAKIQGRQLREKKAKELLEKYRSLDPYAQETILLIIDRELKKTQETIKEEKTEYSITPMRSIPYYQRASAGTGRLVYGDVPTDPIEIPALPEYKDVDYALGVNGNSMKPKYIDGDILLVEQTRSIEVGEIGIFLVDDEAYIKELGEGVLISLNKEFEDIPLTEQSYCLGRVIDKLKR